MTKDELDVIQGRLVLGEGKLAFINELKRAIQKLEGVNAYTPGDKLTLHHAAELLGVGCWTVEYFALQVREGLSLSLAKAEKDFAEF